ncbi:YnbE family lipoprotein [Sphingomonas bacterium]|uniref:YnbE family lipoprotein n=1 Tax=Sphingomonas bacterium TaxID=1895847 RepID=UPI001575C2E1|nr:YnbE family lipoprotein [Sphingomonas bacterium]
MSETGLTKPERITSFVRVRWSIAAVLASAGFGGCVNVSAPDKPIEINLNINVTQQVVYRLDGAAKALIQQNPGIF